MAWRSLYSFRSGSFIRAPIWRTSYVTDLAVLLIYKYTNKKNFPLNDIQLIMFLIFPLFVKFLWNYINNFNFHNFPLSLSPHLMMCYDVLCVLSVNVLSVGVLFCVLVVVLMGFSVTWSLNVCGDLYNLLE